MRILFVFLLMLGFYFPAFADPTERAQKVFSVPANYQVLIDYTTGTNPIYIGYADRNVATSASVWFIIKITWDANNNPTAIKSINNAVWDDRASYTYS